MKRGIFRDSGWKAEVEIIEDKSNEKEEGYVLKVIKTIRKSPYFGSQPDGHIFEVHALREYRHYVDWSLDIVPTESSRAEGG